MEPILSKEEIAELLTSIRDAGKSEGAGSRRSAAESPPPAHREINLFELGTVFEEAAPIDNLEIIIDQFRPVFCSVMSRYLQRSVAIDSIESDFSPFSSYLSSDRGQNAATIIDLAPLKFPAIISCDANLFSILLEFMLGGTAPSETIDPGRTRTKLELHILEKVIEQVCSALESTFKSVIPITCSPLRTVETCRSISHFEGVTPMAVFAMRMSIDACSGQIDLLFPVRTFEPYRESLGTVTQLNRLEKNRWAESIEQTLDKMAVTLMARAETLNLSVRQLIEMKTGDVFFVDNKPGAAVQILVEGVAKFSGAMEHHNQKRNVRITSLAAQE